MGITCIALDLDQTTLNHQGKLSKKNRSAIEGAIQKGIHIIVASGRSFSSLPAEIRDIRRIRYAITSNGAAIYDLHTEECLRQYKMTESSIDAILRYTEGVDVAYEAFIDGKAFAQKAYVDDPVRFGAMPGAIPYIQSTREPIEDIRDFIKENQRRIESIDVVVKKEEQKSGLWRILADHIKDVYITSSVPQLLEISYKESGKHSGVKFLLDYLGLSRDELAAFGDGDNDAELLRFAGVGIAVENASERCKEAADIVTLSNEADGVAYGIEQLLGII